jgi:hypothetical protein
MLPWNYGFHWNTGTMIFMGAFYAVLAIVGATVITAVLRSRRALREEKAEKMRWRSDFGHLRAAERECRHNLTGEMPGRLCPQAFDCRGCNTHAQFIAKHPPAPPAESDEEAFGMSFPLDRLYHRGHAWMRSEPDGSVTVGLDDLGRRLLGEPDSVSLPQPGQRVVANGTAWRARKRNAGVRVLSPVDGEVLETGGPGREWYLRVKPDNRNTAHLLRPHEVKPWLMREMERLQLALASEGAAPTLADGGTPVADIAASYPDADWDAVCGEMFLHP